MNDTTVDSYASRCFTMLAMRATCVSTDDLVRRSPDQRYLLAACSHMAPSQRALPFAEVVWERGTPDQWEGFCEALDALMSSYQHPSGAIMNWDDGDLWLEMPYDDSEPAEAVSNTLIPLGEDYVHWALHWMYPCRCIHGAQNCGFTS